MPVATFCSIPDMTLRRLPALLAFFALIGASTAHAYLDVPVREAGARTLLTRFGYGADQASLRDTLGLSPRQYLRRAIRETPVYPPAIQAHIAALPASTPLPELWARYGPGGTEKFVPAPQQNASNDGKAMRNPREIAGREILDSTIETRLLQSVNSDNPGHEILLNFWLNHFSINGLKTITKYVAADYARSLQMAMREDSFLALLRASFLHPAMQIYLDNDRSTAANSAQGKRASQNGKSRGLNENLARELLELHTLGVDGGYTQADVQALARIITGAGVIINGMRPDPASVSGGVRIGYFFFDPRRHDDEHKRLLGTDYPAGKGFAEIEKALAQLAAHPATARHISRKLALRFYGDEPPAEVLRVMSEAFLRSGGRISETLFAMVNSRSFADTLKGPDKFKEPMDYVLSAVRAVCNGQPVANGKILMRTLRQFNHLPFMRTTPDGYGALEKDWLSSPEMARRIRLAQTLAAAHLPLAADVPPKSGEGRCRPEVASIRQLVGPLSASTTQALQGLKPADEMAALLASPEFMHR